ncbi:HNH endonuclease [Corynebacterium belfantii]|uniref:type II CRISPR RNA-guided endonuclease Cas9 n=1 Tax=Corynebacterium belfantii TaxID=2014537 RepID=UPI0018D308B8|nr:type II CRISPR RNA-guided endonuclease Cas9 [Corynebacterium belfantii]MBG9311033.1 HNH endonuclease [Corynebacterium belfantii]
MKYHVGIDVGTFSVGLAAIEVDDAGMPIKTLSLVSHIHDSGLDPDKIKSAVTRLASSGIARRTRRLYRRKRRRLQQLDKFIQRQGWPVIELEDYSDPLYPWKVRAELAASYIADEKERGEKLSVALRHIARHRGWRNPYAKVSSLYLPDEPSDAFKAIREEIKRASGQPVPETATVGQMVTLCELGTLKLRGEGGVLSARLQQSDHAREIQEICRMQEIGQELYRKIIDVVFAAESPKGSASSRVGKDPLQPGKNRALKASDAFQRYRIAALIGNLRVRVDGEKRILSVEEKNLVFDHLVNLAPKKEPEWVTIAEILGIDRGQLIGTATMTDDGERAGARPPTHDTNRSIVNSRIAPLVDWWKTASALEQHAMVKALSNAEVDDFDSPEGAKVQAFFADLDDDVHAKLDSLHLPVGRAAYSEDTLVRLTRRMLADGVDLYTARLQEFGIEPSWTPPAPRIGEPVGNPAVDRVLKTVSRWLESATKTWGAPERVIIEHVREGFVTEKRAREMDGDMRRRAARNAKLFQEMQEKLNVQGKPSRADLWRYQSVQRQNCQCAYCGSPITFSNSEMDHIVPRAGQGSTNTRENLVAVCHRCNQSKGNTPFAVWAKNTSIEGVSVKEAVERTRHWVTDTGMRSTDFKKFTKAVVERFQRATMDEEIDARSMESVAWMANELRSRVAQHFASHGTTVRVYRGSLTAEARRASGISGKLEFLDGVGKSRLDRRHHAIDAAVIAFTSDYVAETLAVRSNLKQSQAHRQEAPQWREFTGKDAEHRAAWRVWCQKMEKLSALLTEDLRDDRVVVMSNVRLRLGNGSAHEETIGKLSKVKLGSQLSVSDIDKASSEALWCALTREPDFDPKDGLPANPERHIRVNGTHVYAGDNIGLFPVSAGSIALRGGYAELGSSFHHARVYKITSSKKPAFAMLRVYTIDLLPYRNQDLFSVELKPQTMSMRQAEKKLRDALATGNAEYLGWLVVDDELVVDTSKIATDQVKAVEAELGTIRRWRVDGFFGNTRLRLRPLQMSKEGIKKESAPELSKIIDRPGWLPAVNKLFSEGNVTVVRRDSLGRVRLESTAHLPVTWKVQ